MYIVVLSNPSSQSLNVVTSESLRLSLQASPYKACWICHYFYELIILSPCIRSTRKTVDSRTGFPSFFINSDVIAGVIKRLLDLKQVK